MICVVPQELKKNHWSSENLENSDDKYAFAEKVTHDGLWRWESHSNHIYYSARWKSMVGCKQEEVGNNPLEWLVRVHDANIAKLRSSLSSCWQGEILQFEIEYSLLHQDGNYRLMHCKCIAIKDQTGKVIRLIGSQTDISQHQATKAQIHYQADYDALTGLPNRQSFIKILTNLSQLKQDDSRFGILCLDIDRFQYINHNFGNIVGDLLLIKIVDKLQSCLGMSDYLARLDGDEFAILLGNFSQVDYPLEVASKIQQEFSMPLKVKEHSILVTASIGIATIPLEKQPFQSQVETQSANCGLIEFLQSAELALRQAKNQGKACNKVFEPAAYLETQAKFKAQDDLREALEKEQFILHYQPIVQLNNRQLVGFEALARWQHPINGLIMPSKFVSLAEKTGLIMPIGWWVLRSACQKMADWHRHHSFSQPPFISVNITSQQLSQPYASDIITKILLETGLHPQFLKLEITESEIIENIDIVLVTAEKLKKIGVQLSLDDFGTGYSSLSYLHRLPINSLKIDRSFIQDIEISNHKLELVKTIIKLAQVFCLDVIAEGIEQELHSDQLIDLQCKYGQGYLFSQPLSSENAQALLECCLVKS